jgi:hypothetical protein
MFLGSRPRPVSRTGNSTATCEPIVLHCGILIISLPCTPPRPATRIDSFIYKGNDIKDMIGFKESNEECYLVEYSDMQSGIL